MKLSTGHFLMLILSVVWLPAGHSLLFSKCNAIGIPLQTVEMWEMFSFLLAQLWSVAYVHKGSYRVGGTQSCAKP